MPKIGFVNVVAVGSMLCLVAAATACEKDKKEGPQVTTTTGAATSAGEAAARIGVPDCDEYLTRLDRCASSLPAGERASLESSARTQRANMKGMAGSDKGRSELEKMCKMLREGFTQAHPACKA